MHRPDINAIDDYVTDLRANLADFFKRIGFSGPEINVLVAHLTFDAKVIIMTELYRYEAVPARETK